MPQLLGAAAFAWIRARPEPRFTPKPRFGACTLAANGRLDAEVLGVVLRAAGSTKKEQPVLARFSLTPTAPLDEQQRWRISAASLDCDSALAVEVGA